MKNAFLLVFRQFNINQQHKENCKCYKLFDTNWAAYGKLGYLCLFECQILVNNFIHSMRRRYFSPELRQTLQSYKHKQQLKLRWVGSQVKFASPIGFQQQYQQKIGPYTYFSNKEIGSGYSSKVYKAYKANDSTQYAAKIIDLRKYSASNMQMLTNQIQILKSLDHPNVLKCYDVIKTASQCCIVTEYCNNGDLLSHLAKRGRFSQKEAIQIISDVSAGLKYLCQLSIIHRDLKPANILKSGSRWKIADFGFAIRSQTQIRTKYNVGTPLYMPPQSLIQNIYSTKSDIFSVGIILYQLLIGCTPWQSRTQKDLIKKMGAVPFKIPDKYKISLQLKAILQSMCQVKARKRMQKKDLINLNFQKLPEVNENPEQQKILKRQKSLDPIKQKLICSNQGPRLMRLISSKSILEAQQDVQLRKKQAYNNQILICQLHYCRFLYYLVRNGNCVLVDRKQVQKLCVIIFTHLLKLVKQISDSSSNHLNLADWQKFKHSKKYLNTNLTIKQYCLRYQKQYLSYLKNVQPAVLSEVNEMFPENGKGSCIGLEFYSKIIRFLVPLLRAFNHNLGNKLSKHEGEITKEQAGHIQALKSVLKYYRLLQLSISHYEDYQYFESHCNIKVNIDFKKSGMTVQHFHQLRRQLKNF